MPQCEFHRKAGTGKCNVFANCGISIERATLKLGKNKGEPPVKDKMKYDLVVFDMDGTVLDTLEDLCNSLNCALFRCGFAQHTPEEVKRFVGNGVKMLVERALPPEATAEDAAKVSEEFMSVYREHCNDQTKPYRGVTELLRTLKARGCRTAVASNKADVAVQKLCEIHFKGLLDFAVGEKVGINKKPAPNSVLAAMNALGSRHAVYVGDSEVDIQTAKNAGVDCISVTWGFRDRDFLLRHGAEVFADSTEDILTLIQN